MRIALLFLAACGALFIGHARFLRVPLFWDELGYFVPAALDLYRTGAWVPHTTAPNIHPPGIPAYLAGVWLVTGYSIPATRAAMLLLAAAGLAIAYLLAVELAGRTAAALAAGLLLVSPLFFAQSMMAQLDMPAMVCTLLALLLFLREKMGWSAAACCALVLVKETGLVVPAVLGGWLWRERRRREAMWFVSPAVLLGAWVMVLYRATGHPLGNAEFAGFNALFPLHPVRVAVALARRLYFLFAADFLWIGTCALALAWKRGACFRSRAWRIVWLLVLAHVVFLSVTGGATLERYLLPVLPLVLIAMAAALRRFHPAAAVASYCGLAAGIFWNPPYPFPFENNLAFVDFAELHREAAGFLEREYAADRIATVWPLTDALARPEFGYVAQPMTVRERANFDANADLTGVAVIAVYSRIWGPRFNWFDFPWVRAFWARFYGFRTPLSRADLARAGLAPVKRWERRGQWIEIHARKLP